MLIFGEWVYGFRYSNKHITFTIKKDHFYNKSLKFLFILFCGEGT